MSIVDGSDALDQAAILLQQGVSHQQEGNAEKAEGLYRQVLAADPANPDALNLLAVIHHERGDRDLAVRLLRSAVKLNRSAGRYWNNLAVVLGARGDRAGCVAALREMTFAAPDDPNGWMALIFAMDLHPHSLPDVRLADRRQFNARHCAALTAKAQPHPNDRDPARRLRVGYVSADFKKHSAPMVFGPVLAGHDHEAVEVYCYASLDGPGDDLTTALQKRADTWHNVSQMSDLELAEQIRKDRIDILVDLSGYSGGNRLLAFARKPAPVQITAWGHVTGTGLDCMDWIIADETAVPVWQESQYHERILRAPCTIPYEPRLPYPEAAPPPSLHNGHVTFGYLGRANKTSEGVWAAWAQVLHRVPHSRLVLKSADYTDESYRARITDYLISLRIGTNRFEFRGLSDHVTHLGTYNDIDIALDSFPQGGGVTAMEAALMGVPTVTLLGDYLNGRIAPSILNVLRHPEWVAESPDEYVDIAANLAGWPRTLADRLDLRTRLFTSILCDPDAYTRRIEALYRHAWQEWLDQTRTSDEDEAPDVMSVAGG